MTITSAYEEMKRILGPYAAKIPTDFLRRKTPTETPSTTSQKGSLIYSDTDTIHIKN